METVHLKTIKQITKLLACRNHVLLRRKYKNEEHVTESGILVIADTTFRPYMHADRISEVVMVPDSLYYNVKKPMTSNFTESMPWDADIEIRPGDVVWHTFMNLSGQMEITTDEEPGELYRTIRYDDIYLAQRGDELIMLNGYCLCEEVLEEKQYSVDLLDPEVDTTRGRVALLGKPNRGYKTGWKSRDLDSGCDIREGDLIVKLRADHHIRLEEEVHAKFPLEEKMYFIIQRKDIMAVLEPAEETK